MLQTIDRVLTLIDDMEPEQRSVFLQSVLNDDSPDNDKKKLEQMCKNVINDACQAPNKTNDDMKAIFTGVETSCLALAKTYKNIIKDEQLFLAAMLCLANANVMGTAGLPIGYWFRHIKYNGYNLPDFYHRKLPLNTADVMKLIQTETSDSVTQETPNKKASHSSFSNCTIS